MDSLKNIKNLIKRCHATQLTTRSVDREVASDETAIVLVSGSHKKNCEEGEGVVP